MFQGVHDLHFATSSSERDHIIRAVLQRWGDDALDSESMRMFVYYMKEWWLPVTVTNILDWPIFFTSRRMTTTNNAVDQFNAVYKSVSDLISLVDKAIR